MSRATRIYEPRPAMVTADSDGAPVTVDGVSVEALREEWVVEEGWWTSRPLCRWYFELILAGGRDLTVFRSLPDGQWYLQRA